MNNSILERQKKEKDGLIEQLKKTPIIQYACEKASISRATYYRWHKDDKKFAEAADTALIEGSNLINDMAESQLIAAIKNQNMSGIIFWLKHHHPSYKTRIELALDQKPHEELTPEQEEIVRKALRLAALTENDSIQKEDHAQQ
jgi:predicted DNA binding protein